MLIEEIAERFLGPCVPAYEVADTLNVPGEFLTAQIASQSVPGGFFVNEWYIPKEWADLVASPAGKAAFEVGLEWGMDH